MKALIDFDVLLYRCGFAAEKSVFKVYAKGSEEEFGCVNKFSKIREAKEWIGDNQDLYIVKEVIPDPLENCLHSVKVQINGILEATQATSYQGFLTGKNQFREKVAVTAPYKGNRDPTHKPYHYQEIKRYLIERWQAKVVDHYEADDALAMNQVWSVETGTEGVSPTIICTIDKDLDQVPGWHYNFLKKEKYWVTEEDALRWFYIQLIAGDTTDNIPGIRGQGVKTAEKALKDCVTEKEMYEKAFELYKEAYLGDTNIAMAALNECAQLVYMVREEGVTWSPPQ